MRRIWLGMGNLLVIDGRACLPSRSTGPVRKRVRGGRDEVSLYVRLINMTFEERCKREIPDHRGHQGGPTLDRLSSSV